MAEQRGSGSREQNETTAGGTIGKKRRGMNKLIRKSDLEFVNRKHRPSSRPRMRRGGRAVTGQVVGRRIDGVDGSGQSSKSFGVWRLTREAREQKGAGLAESVRLLPSR